MADCGQPPKHYGMQAEFLKPEFWIWQLKESFESPQAVVGFSFEGMAGKRYSKAVDSIS